MKNILIKILKYLGIFLLFILIVGVLFINLSPQFGGKISKEQKEAYAKTGHYEDGIFINKEPMHIEMNCHSLKKMITDMLNPNPHLAPENNLEVKKVSTETLLNNVVKSTRVLWFGHSTFLVEMDGKFILIDPVFSQVAAPSPLLGRKRYNKEMPMDIEDLPEIDFVVISHNHYDHLDYESIKKLKSKVKKFFVPLGDGSHLKSWEVPEDHIVEMDWWKEFSIDSTTITFVPSRHTSGRGLSDRDASLWGGWIFEGPNDNIYYSGDGGYGKYFKEIREKYGPFDLGIMECGQYNKLWKDMHMVPEQTVQAGLDVGAQVIVPAHWGAFSLAMHTWKDPIERVTAEGERSNLPIATPQIGELFSIKPAQIPTEKWWVEIE